MTQTGASESESGALRRPVLSRSPFGKQGRTAMTGSFLERLAAGEAVIHGSGYLFEMERRGYLAAGGYVPEVVIDHPEVVEQLHEEFVRCGSDVVLAFTYYGHRERLRLIGREHLLEQLNRDAIAIARRVVDRHPGTLLAGGTCNTNMYDPDDPATDATARAMFEEQIGWAAEEGVDYIVCETLSHLGEARIAIDVCKQAGLPLVLGFAIHRSGKLRDFDGSLAEACRISLDEGAHLVGFNCHRGPATMYPLLREVAGEVDPARLCTWAVAYRTTALQPAFGALVDDAMPFPEALPGGLSFPVGLDPFQCTRYEMGDFASKCHELGLRYFGGCCGTGPHHVRAMAEAIGRTPLASRYSPDMSKHYALGTDERLLRHNRDYVPHFTATPARSG